jgi:FkbM family methyltransferase
LEPNPESFARLERHRRMNNLPWLKTYQAAASAQSGVSQLLTYGNLDSTTTHLPYDGEAVGEMSVPLAVRTLRLDDEVEAGRLRAPQFVKIDVEGSGHGALLGMQRSLAASRPTLLIAFHNDAEVNGAMSILEPLEYHRTAIVPPLSGSDSMVGADFWFTVGGTPG